MNERREETAVPVIMEYGKKKDDIEKKLNSYNW